jgi:type II secretory pathway predicted ATPase ExeA
LIGYWGLQKNPFAELDSPYVALPSHDEAVARLTHGIESLLPRVALIAPAGLGKSVVLRQAFRQVRDPVRRLVTLSARSGASDWVATLAERLGQRLGPEPDRLLAWRALERALRVTSLNGFQVVIAMEDSNAEFAERAELDLDSLEHVGSSLHPPVTIIQVARGDHRERCEVTDRWSSAIGLQALTRSQTEHYLTGKLSWAGGTREMFTARAITRLHALAAGNPRRVERLAADCLTAGARCGLEVIPAELVDDLMGSMEPPN